MKTITLIFAAAALTFAQTPAVSHAAQAPAKDSTAMSAPVKKSTHKHMKKVPTAAVKPAVAAPVSR